MCSRLVGQIDHEYLQVVETRTSDEERSSRTHFAKLVPLSNMAYRAGVRVMWRVTSERRRGCRSSVMSILLPLVRDCGLQRCKRILCRLSSFISDVSRAIVSLFDHRARLLRKLLLFGARDTRFLYLFMFYNHFYCLNSSRNILDIALEISFII